MYVHHITTPCFVKLCFSEVLLFNILRYPYTLPYLQYSIQYPHFFLIQPPTPKYPLSFSPISNPFPPLPTLFSPLSIPFSYSPPVLPPLLYPFNPILPIPFSPLSITFSAFSTPFSLSSPTHSRPSPPVLPPPPNSLPF